MKIEIENIIINPVGDNKYEVIKDIIKKSQINDSYKEKSFSEVEKREKHQSTAVGNGIGIAHAEIADFKGTKVLVGVLDQGIDYDAWDDIMVNLIFVILMEKDMRNEYLINLSKISKLCRKETIIESLKKSNSKDEIVNILGKFL